jgi:phosphoribosylaminoimidazole-succinocarboxamide synthase
MTEKSKIFNEGKTKQIYLVKGDPKSVIVRNKNDITKNDDPNQTEVMTGKAELATTTTSAVFQLLKDAGIPVAYERQLSFTDFLAPKVDMILLEIIWRRYGVGSFLKRHPELGVSKGELPHRFHSSVFELFLKTTGKVVEDKYGNKIGNIMVDDPFIANPYDEKWKLFHPKKPDWDEEADLKMSIDCGRILPSNVEVSDIEDLLRRVGLVLERAWAQVGCNLIDFKIEMGVTADDQLVVADVIDADSWRLRDPNWQELSKQLFRDNVDMEQIADKYALVARLVEQLRIPKQAIVVWRGSKDDPFPKFPNVSGVEIVDVVLSGHKSPQRCLRELEKILTRFPEGGVILACAGMSNGLGPTLSARTSWQVIGVAISSNEFPADAWSNLRTPSQVPMLTVMNPKNAILAALNILGQKNPAAYAERQLAIEKLDD